SLARAGTFLPPPAPGLRRARGRLSRRRGLSLRGGGRSRLRGTVTRGRLVEAELLATACPAGTRAVTARPWAAGVGFRRGLWLHGGLLGRANRVGSRRRGPGGGNLAGGPVGGP